jgi:hypothetical protein
LNLFEKDEKNHEKKTKEVKMKKDERNLIKHQKIELNSFNF